MKTIKGRIARLVIIVGAVAVLIVGGTTIVLNYSSTNNMLKQSMTETAKLASERVRQELRNYETIAMEVGSIARLSNSETPLEDKKAIIDQRVSTNLSAEIFWTKKAEVFLTVQTIAIRTITG
jgi:methyl-accepting chemotaxis protein